jgi:hypothetical protein
MTTYVTLTQVKQALRQTHNDDDDLLERLIASAESECLRYLGRTELPTLPVEYPEQSSDGSLIDEEVPSSGDPVAPDVVNGIILMVQADYDGDPLNRDKLREAAQNLWNPYALRDRFSL